MVKVLRRPFFRHHSFGSFGSKPGTKIGEQLNPCIVACAAIQQMGGWTLRNKNTSTWHRMNYKLVTRLKPKSPKNPKKPKKKTNQSCLPVYLQFEIQINWKNIWYSLQWSFYNKMWTIFKNCFKQNRNFSVMKQIVNKQEIDLNPLKPQFRRNDDLTPKKGGSKR